jgi:hypothetical protein
VRGLNRATTVCRSRIGYQEVRVVISGKSWHRVKVTSGVAIALGAGTTFCHLAAAADFVAPVVVVAPGNLDHPTTEVTPGGTVILRGSGSPKADANPPAPERILINDPAARLPTAPSQGFDRNFDASGIHRNFDLNFDHHGLTQPHR